MEWHLQTHRPLPDAAWDWPESNGLNALRLALARRCSLYWTAAD